MKDKKKNLPIVPSLLMCIGTLLLIFGVFLMISSSKVSEKDNEKNVNNEVVVSNDLVIDLDKYVVTIKNVGKEINSYNNSLHTVMFDYISGIENHTYYVSYYLEDKIDNNELKVKRIKDKDYKYLFKDNVISLIDDSNDYSFIIKVSYMSGTGIDGIEVNDGIVDEDVINDDEFINLLNYEIKNK